MYRSCSLKSTSRITRHFNLICCIGTPLLQPIKHIRHRLTCFSKNLPKIHKKHLRYAYFPPAAVVHAREKIAAPSQRTLPSGLPPLAGEASYADSGRALPCTRAYAAGTPRRGGVLCGRHQRALPSGLPLGLCPRPRDAAHLLPRLRAGRGIFYAHKLFHILLNGPPERLRAVRLFALQIF